MWKCVAHMGSLCAVAAVVVLMSCLGASGALAHIVTTVTVRNNTAFAMTFRSPAGQILGTVSPGPAGIAAGGETLTFTVDSHIPTIASIHFYLENGSRVCRFDTSYTANGGYTKMATSSGGTFVGCAAGAISFDPTTHDYSITFTLS
jgi:hypothetical protein